MDKNGERPIFVKGSKGIDSSYCHKPKISAIFSAAIDTKALKAKVVATFAAVKQCIQPVFLKIAATKKIYQKN